MRIKRFLRYAGQGLRIVVLLCITIILIGNLYIAAAGNLFGQKNPTFFGFSTAIVLTGSMSGSIEANDVVVTRKQDTYAVGDVITFSADGSSVTHRIISIDEEGYHTKGDANNTADRLPTAPESVTGKVILVIPKVGAVLGFVRTPLGILCFLGVMLLMVELPHIGKLLKKRTDVP